MGRNKDKKSVSLQSDKSPIRKSERRKRKSVKYDEEDYSTPTEPKRAKHKDITPEKLPVAPTTPRKSRQSKDMSPPPVTKYRQNRMPEQTSLVKSDGKSFYVVLWRLTL